jgi:23S rRNA pseudouridine1911/1915/1917 synthase
MLIFISVGEKIFMSISLEVAAEKERLDRWLAMQITELSRSRIQDLVETGCVKVNDRICLSKKEIIKTGDRICIDIPATQPLELQAEAIPLNILYEDSQLIIVDKPAGLVVHPAPGHESGTLVNALLHHCRDLIGIGGVERPGIVHRLDKDTTGAIVAAKTELALSHLQEQLKNKTARRIYWGVVHGAPKTEKGTIDLPIGRHRVERQKMAIVPEAKGGRKAVTHWRILERLGKYSLLEFQLETGRTHQIRVHTAQMGHSIVGDPVYSSGRFPIKLTGQALHARQLILEHPVSGETIEAIALLPHEFEKLLVWLRQRGC